MKVYKTNTEPSRYVFSSYIVNMLCVISVPFSQILATSSYSYVLVLTIKFKFLLIYCNC